jgi:hypothetical protein
MRLEKIKPTQPGGRDSQAVAPATIFLLNADAS